MQRRHLSAQSSFPLPLHGRSHQCSSRVDLASCVSQGRLSWIAAAAETASAGTGAVHCSGPTTRPPPSEAADACMSFSRLPSYSSCINRTQLSTGAVRPVDIGHINLPQVLSCTLFSFGNAKHCNGSSRLSGCQMGSKGMDTWCCRSLCIACSATLLTLLEASGCLAARCSDACAAIRAKFQA